MVLVKASPADKSVSNSLANNSFISNNLLVINFLEYVIDVNYAIPLKRAKGEEFKFVKSFSTRCFPGWKTEAQQSDMLSMEKKTGKNSVLKEIQKA